MTDDARVPRQLVAGIGVFVLIFVLIGADVITDYGAGVSVWHLAAELAILLLSAAGAVVLWWRLLEARETVADLEVDVVAARAEAERWRGEVREYVGGLRAAILHEFGRWGLTPAEREVALALLRGLSHKEVAGQRDTSERTVRQQARTVYQKAGLRSRSELAAFFLDDVLAPPSGP